jgi:hypothetical protein
MKGTGLGGKRPGAGRPCKSVSLKAGDELFITKTTAEGQQTDLWRVEFVSRTRIDLRNRIGDTIRFER